MNMKHTLTLLTALLLAPLAALYAAESESKSLSANSSADGADPSLSRTDELERIFQKPPESAKPGVWWHWMGSNVTRAGITRDLEALKDAGFNRTTIFSLADTVTPSAGQIGNSPTPEIIGWTEPWWKLVRHAAEESKRLGMDLGMHNCPGYTASGGTWIPEEMSMQKVCFSQTPFSGPGKLKLDLPRPTVDLHEVQAFPIFNPNTGKAAKPEIPERNTFYRDIAMLALPATGIVTKDHVINLTGQKEWAAPAGDWIIYRFGYTTTGKLIQPAQLKATGFECDKMKRRSSDVPYEPCHWGDSKTSWRSCRERFNACTF